MVTARINTPGVIGKVAVRPAQRTTIADPKFKPKPNVAITEVQGVDVITHQQDGDVLTFNAVSGNYESQPLTNVNVNISTINGGAF
jgi:hypothetical protein